MIAALCHNRLRFMLNHYYKHVAALGEPFVGDF